MKLQKHGWIQFFKFGLVGVSNTLISLGVYYAFVWANPRLYLVGSVAGFFVSVLNAYFWNHRYVFKKEKRNHFRALLKTIFAYGGTSALGILLLAVMVEILGVSEWVAPLLNLAITVPLNFVLNKYWAFRS